MNDGTRALIEAVHAASPLCVLVVTGGGAGAVAQLLAVPGASRTVLEARVPYHNQTLVEFLGQIPEQFCSAATSRLMAYRAHERAAALAPGQPVLGLGCTATLVTDRPKRGDHRCHLATHNGQTTRTFSLTLTKGARARAGEEAVVNAVLLNALAEAMQLPQRSAVDLLPGEQLETTTSHFTDPLSLFLAEQLPCVCIDSDGQARAASTEGLVLLSGSFNPVHAGHRTLAELVARRAKRAVHFELSVHNVDKPPLTDEEIRRRSAQFAWHAPLWLTRAPRFVDKAALFPGAVFLIGIDTAERLIDPRYYGQSSAQMEAALTQIARAECRFLVAGRVAADGQFQSLGQLTLPPCARTLFEEIPEHDFRVDLSSTALRRVH